MDFSEFKRILGAEPLSRDPEVLRARSSAPEFEEAAREAEDFERSLQRAIEISVDEAVLDTILEIPYRQEVRRPPRWMALAASILIVAGAAGITWVQSRQPGTIEEYVAQHHAHDGVKMLAQTDGFADAGRIEEIMAGLQLSASGEFSGRITLIKYCPTMDGRGIHMIVATDTGPMQVIYMPGTQVDEGHEFRFASMHAHLLNLAGGSVAVIGRLDQPVAGMDSLLRASLLPRNTDA
jgi:hypothetical protein